MFKNKVIKWFKSLNYKSALVYFLVIQVLVLASAFFLPMPIVPLLRFIFKEEGILRETFEIVVMLILELITKFIVFFAFFKNDRNLHFKEFCKSYGLTAVLRLIFSTIFYFAAWSAGMTICLTGNLLGRLWIDNDIKTMKDVPFWLYLVTFIVFEGLVCLIAFLSSKLAAKQRERIKQELMNNKETN
ncbi:MAG: hypothetical protein J6B45_05660 [Clostridia bacterium]|nr:hypothetical protein [Clostridia bacterium]